VNRFFEGEAEYSGGTCCCGVEFEWSSVQGMDKIATYLPACPMNARVDSTAYYVAVVLEVMSCKCS
jgi:hypothetical protein